MTGADVTLDVALEQPLDGLVGFGLDDLGRGVSRAVPSRAEHPPPQLVAADVPVTVNSDDPPMVSTTRNQKCEVAADSDDPPMLSTTRNQECEVAADSDDPPMVSTTRNQECEVAADSDDPPMLSTTPNQECEVAAALLDLDDGVAELARQAVRYPFPDDHGEAAVIDHHTGTAAR